jgi:cyanate permease
MGLGALLWGRLIEATGSGYRYAFLGAAVCLLVCGVLGFMFMRDKVFAERVKHREYTEEPPQAAEPSS